MLQTFQIPSNTFVFTSSNNLMRCPPPLLIRSDVARTMAGRGRAATIPAWMTSAPPSGVPSAPGAPPTIGFLPPPATGAGAPPIAASSAEPKSSWTEHTAPDGRRKYWHDASTGRSTYEKPVFLMTATERADATTRWKEATAPDGRVYFHHLDTKATKWQMPDEVRVAREAALREEGAAAAKAAIAAAEAASKGNASGNPAKGSSNAEAPKTYASPEEALEAFLNCLADAGVASTHRWDEATRMCGSDNRFLSLKTTGERKKRFHEYQAKRSKKEREERRALDKKKRNAFNAMLREAEDTLGSGAPNVAFRQVAEDLVKHPLYAQRFKDVVEDREKEDLYRGHCETLRVRERETRRRRRDEEKQKFTELLVEKNVNNWRDARSAKGDPRYENCDRYDRLVAFERFADDMDKKERDMRDADALKKRLTERDRRDSFTKFLTEKRRDGKLKCRLPWRDFYESEGLIENDVYLELAQNTGGSRPRELYEDQLEVLENDAAIDRRVTIEALIQTKIIKVEGDGSTGDVAPNTASVRRALAVLDAHALIEDVSTTDTARSAIEQVLSGVSCEDASSSIADRLRVACGDAIAVAIFETKQLERKRRRTSDSFARMLESARRRRTLASGSTWEDGVKLLGREPEWWEMCDAGLENIKNEESDLVFGIDETDYAAWVEGARKTFTDVFQSEDGELEEGEAPVAKRAKVDGS